MHPILKTSSSIGSNFSSHEDSLNDTEAVHHTGITSTGSGRRVTFSPFVKGKQKRRQYEPFDKKPLFSIISLIKEEDKQRSLDEQKHELATMEMMYNASHTDKLTMKDKLLKKYNQLKSWYQNCLEGTSSSTTAGTTKKRRRAVDSKQVVQKNDTIEDMKDTNELTEFEKADFKYIEAFKSQADESAAGTPSDKTSGPSIQVHLHPLHEGSFCELLIKEGYVEDAKQIKRLRIDQNKEVTTKEDELEEDQDDLAQELPGLRN